MRLSRARCMFSTVRSSETICCCVMAKMATIVSGTCSRGERAQQVGPARRPHDEQPDGRARRDAGDEAGRDRDARRGHDDGAERGERAPGRDPRRGGGRGEQEREQRRRTPRRGARTPRRGRSTQPPTAIVTRNSASSTQTEWMRLAVTASSRIVPSLTRGSRRCMRPGPAAELLVLAARRGRRRRPRRPSAAVSGASARSVLSPMCAVRSRWPRRVRRRRRPVAAAGPAPR